MLILLNNGDFLCGNVAYGKEKLEKIGVYWLLVII